MPAPSASRRTPPAICRAEGVLHQAENDQHRQHSKRRDRLTMRRRHLIANHTKQYRPDSPGDERKQGPSYPARHESLQLLGSAVTAKNENLLHCFALQRDSCDRTRSSA